MLCAAPSRRVGHLERRSEREALSHFHSKTGE
jgi:hypothetical protein